MEDKKIIGRLDFERVLALSYKAAKFCSAMYKADIALAEEKALDVWVEFKDDIHLLSEDEVLSKDEIEKKIYFIFKDEVRRKLGIYQKIVKGERLWFSPFMQETESGYDTCVEDDYAAFEIFPEENQKEIYYQHKALFKLTPQEELFVDLCFSGFNPQNEIDVLVFMEAMNTDSTGYVKTFFNRLCKKLKERSEKIGLR